MNPSCNSPNTSDDRCLDLLVDGELGETERCELLLQLDHETDGWRRLAMAFLEAQAWKLALGAAASKPAAIAASPSPAVRRRKLPLGRLGTAVAMAASFLAAITLGLMAINDRHSRPDQGGGMVAGVKPGEQQTGSPSNHWTLPVVPSESAVASAKGSQAWRTVRVALPGGPQGNAETIELPAIERDRLDEAWLSNLPSALPPEVLGALNGRGYEVHQRRELLPVDMQDGRGLVVPVDQVEVRYVGGHKFQ